MSEQIKYCCQHFEEAVLSGGIKKFIKRWISDIVLSREDKSTFSQIYNIEGITFMIYNFCPYCGAKLQQ